MRFASILLAAPFLTSVFASPIVAREKDLAERALIPANPVATVLNDLNSAIGRITSEIPGQPIQHVLQEAESSLSSAVSQVNSKLQASPVGGVLNGVAGLANTVKGKTAADLAQAEKDVSIALGKVVHGLNILYTKIKTSVQKLDTDAKNEFAKIDSDVHNLFAKLQSAYAGLGSALKSQLSDISANIDANLAADLNAQFSGLGLAAGANGLLNLGIGI